ncbi:pyridoxal phosphate-dependent aminotransferase [Maribacter sp. 2307ULW6-5]|uniref:pyridoxal phosphate-dependent aminotransferase n=1 Tax=Maribacter sp. 2307ULW6-5 TaxID=3386275 RepID=UPI0039BCC4FA
MMTIEQKFEALKADNAPGQEVRQTNDSLDGLVRGEMMGGVPVDFSHGDVDAFPPTPHSNVVWNEGFAKGGAQAYTEYRGDLDIRTSVAEELGAFTGRPVSANDELIITPGTQGALFLALGATVSAGTKVAVVEPDYFANRKLVRFFGGTVVPITLSYAPDREAGISLEVLEMAFSDGVEVMVFSTPNNPTGHVYPEKIIKGIAQLAKTYGVAIIVDQLYSRMLYGGTEYTHLRAQEVLPEQLITIMGPSKTESLSGFRLGVAFGTSALVERMERLQAIVSLRAAGYSQAALRTWFKEPEGWLSNRIAQHQEIRDALLKIFNDANLVTSVPGAGSYLFPQLPPLAVNLHTFVRLLRYQANVTVTPGTEFAPDAKDGIRLNFSQDRDAAVAAAKRIVKMVALYKK